MKNNEKEYHSYDVEIHSLYVEDNVTKILFDLTLGGEQITVLAKPFGNGQYDSFEECENPVMTIDFDGSMNDLYHSIGDSYFPDSFDNDLTKSVQQEFLKWQEG